MKTKITPEEYSSILKSLELDDISLSEGSIKVFDCSKNGGTINLNFKDKYTFSESNNKAFFLASFKLEGTLGEEENKEVGNTDDEVEVNSTTEKVSPNAIIIIKKQQPRPIKPIKEKK